MSELRRVLMSRLVAIRQDLNHTVNKLNEYYSFGDSETNDKTEEIQARWQSIEDDLTVLEEYVKQIK